MTPERRRQVEEIVISALALEGDERAARLDVLCATDPDLRHEVESLLAQEHRAAGFMETPALEVSARAMATSPSGVLPGSTAGPYRIDTLLGAGGMGEVYRGWDMRLRRAVALKFLPREYLCDPVARERFQREARATSALNHPNICTVYDIGDFDGRPFIALEYLEGGTLRSHLRSGSLGKRKALDYAAQVAEGLAAAHQKGIVHRDLKPENLWVTCEGRVKILDFGLAKMNESPAGLEAATVSMQTEPGKVMGTVGYMSPEQVRGLPVDQRSDIFSLGVILHEMLTGKRAFDGPSAVDILSAILHRDPPALPDPALNRLVRRCLEKDMEERLHTVSELAAHIEKLKGDDSSGRISTLAVIFQRPQRGRHIAGLAILLTVSGLAAVGLYWKYSHRRLTAETPAATQTIKSIAVLPLKNLSGDAAQNALTEGITEALTTNLARIGAIRVISRSSTIPYSEHLKPSPQIAKELGVDAVVEGSVTRSGDKVRVTAQLTDARTGAHLWAQSYERGLGEILDLEDSAALDIASQIKVKLSTGERETWSPRRPVKPDAYEAYVRGRHEITKQSPQGMRNGVQYFQQAIDLDPLYAAAYAGLADSFSLMANYAVLPPKEVFPRAEAAANKALELDPSLAEAHASLAFARHHFDWDWAGAEAGYRRAIELSPSFSLGHLRYADLLTSASRHDEALREINTARELDPLSSTIAINVAHVFFYARRYDEAIEQLQKVLWIDPKRGFGHVFLGMSYEQKHLYAEAMREVKQATELMGGTPGDDLAHLYAITGRPDMAERILREHVEVPNAGGVVNWVFIAGVYAALGQKDRAFTWLEKAYQNRDYFMTYLQVFPWLDPLRSDPRFSELVRRVGIPGGTQ